MNNVSLSGNLTKKPEIRATQTGKQVASLSIAINEGKDKTEYVNCIAWDKTAELLVQYTDKGDRLACTGRLQTRSWEDGSGQKRYATEVVIEKFDFPPKRYSEPVSNTESAYNSGGVEDDQIPFAPFMKGIL